VTPVKAIPAMTFDEELADFFVALVPFAKDGSIVFNNFLPSAAEKSRNRIRFATMNSI
jgi:hypothetical protein